MNSIFKVDGYKMMNAIIDSGMSIKQLSKRTGVTAATIYSYCKGKSARMENLQKVAKALGVKPSSLIQ